MYNQDNSVIKRESIIGLPVIDGKTGKRLGMVRDIYTADHNTHMEGMYVAQSGWTKKSLNLPFSDVTISSSAVIADGDMISEPEAGSGDSGAIQKLIKKKVIREDGRELGYISDILLDPLTGRIEGLELSESVIGDLIAGRRVLPYQPDEHTRGDVIVITVAQADSLVSYNKGIKNMFRNKI